MRTTHRATIALRLAGFIGVTPATLMWAGPVYTAADAMLGGLALSAEILVGYMLGDLAWVAAFLIPCANESTPDDGRLRWSAVPYILAQWLLTVTGVPVAFVAGLVLLLAMGD